MGVGWAGGNLAGFEAEDVGLDSDSASYVLCDLDLGKVSLVSGLQFSHLHDKRFGLDHGTLGAMNIQKLHAELVGGFKGVIRLIRVTGPSPSAQSIISTPKLVL